MAGLQSLKHPVTIAKDVPVFIKWLNARIKGVFRCEGGADLVATHRNGACRVRMHHELAQLGARKLAA